MIVHSMVTSDCTVSPELVLACNSFCVGSFLSQLNGQSVRISVS